MSSSLYRRSLKLALDWAVHRYVWRGQALYIRGLFEANKHVTEPRQQRVCAFPGCKDCKKNVEGNIEKSRQEHGKHMR
jgi:hypothetical protein